MQPAVQTHFQGLVSFPIGEILQARTRGGESVTWAANSTAVPAWKPYAVDSDFALCDEGLAGPWEH
jgi:hypothetical protein